MINKNKILIIFLVLLFSVLAFSQASVTRENNITMTRGDSVVCTLKVIGDKSDHALSFAVKEGTAFTDTRLIQKDTSDGISLSYSSPYTYILVTIKPEDTQDLTAKLYYYDVYDSTVKQTIVNAYLTIKSDVQTPFDGTSPPTDGTRFYVAGTFLEATVSDGSVFVWDSTNQTMNAISKDSLWDFLSVSDTVDNAIALEMLDFKNYSLTFIYPTTDEDVLIDKTHRALTIDSIFCSTKDSSVAFNILYASTRNGSATGVFSGNQIITTPTTLTSFANATIPANRYLIFQFSTVAGIVNEEFYAKIYYGY